MHRGRVVFGAMDEVVFGRPAREAVVEQLEEGDLPLEESLAMFEEGVRLSRAGAKRLDEAERRVEELLAAGDELQTSPLDESEAGEQ